MGKKSGQSAKKFMIRSEMEDQAKKKTVKKKDTKNPVDSKKVDMLFGKNNALQKSIDSKNKKTDSKDALKKPVEKKKKKPNKTNGVKF